MSEYKKATFAPFNDAARSESIKKCNKSNRLYTKNFETKKREAIAKASNNGKCWWVEQYLCGVFNGQRRS
jgi:hypothetical protein